MEKIFFSILLDILIGLSSFVSGCGVTTTPPSATAEELSNLQNAFFEGTLTIDYDSAEAYEQALNNGEDTTNKIVSFDIKEVAPNSIVGFNIQAGKHLNFKSSDEKKVSNNDHITVISYKAKKRFGMWFIDYGYIGKNTLEATNNVTVSDKADNSNNTIQTKEANNENQFYEAIKSIGMEEKNITNIESLPDWASGKRYSFVYDGFRYIVYELDNGEIDSINTDNNYVKIYERGYKPLDYHDFEPDMNVVSELQADTANQLVNYIDGELTSEVQTDSISRIYDFYAISGTVKAKNFADKKTYSFSACYQGKECVFLSLGDSIIFGSDKKPAIEKTEISDTNDTSEKSDAIILSYGKEGSCGKVDYFDGDPYIRYYVPEGNYEVTCNVRGGFYIESIALHKEDGYDTADTILQQEIKPSDKLHITIHNGECISLYINTEIVLTPQ